MKTTLLSYIVLTAIVAVLTAPRVAHSAPFTWDRVWAGDHFTLSNVFPNFREAGDPLFGTKPEVSTIINTANFDGVVPYPWQGSTDLKLAANPSESGDGIVIDGSGNSTKKMAYLESFNYAPNTPSNDVWWIQADVKPTTTDKVSLGFIENYGIQGTTFSGVGGLGLLWGGLIAVDADTARWNLCSRDNINMETAEIEIDTSISHKLSVEWDLATNIAQLKVDGNNVGTGIDLDTLVGLDWNYWDVQGLAMELAGGASLDNYAATPEPGAIAMLGMGFVGFGFVVHRQRRNRLANSDTDATPLAA